MRDRATRSCHLEVLFESGPANSRVKYIIATVAAAAIAITFTSEAFSQDAKRVVTASAEVSKGEIKKINQDAGKLTIKHGELKNISMPAMTMVFGVSDKAALAKLKTGDKITFVAGNANGQLTATNIKVSE